MKTLITIAVALLMMSFTTVNKYDVSTTYSAKDKEIFNTLRTEGCIMLPEIVVTYDTTKNKCEVAIKDHRKNLPILDGKSQDFKDGFKEGMKFSQKRPMMRGQFRGEFGRPPMMRGHFENRFEGRPPMMNERIRSRFDQNPGGQRNTNKKEPIPTEFKDNK